MKKMLVSLCALLALGLAGCSEKPQSEAPAAAQPAPATVEPADFVFTNGTVYTVNELQPWAESVAVRGKEIVYVGDAAGAAALVGEGTERIDLEGMTLLPGFISTHDHLIA